MGATKRTFQDLRASESLSYAEEAARKRTIYRAKVVSEVKRLKDSKEESVNFEYLEKIEPYSAFDEFVLAVGDAPKWYIDHILDKYQRDDTFNMRPAHIDFLKYICLPKK